MPKANLLTRDLYRQIKSMNRDAMEKTINNIYDMGARLFVAGSSVFHAEDPSKAIDELKRCGTLS